MTVETDEELVSHLVTSQMRLYGLILCMLPDRERAKDVLQNTNLAIWRKRGSFVPGTDFWAWASQIARFEVRNSCRKRSFDRHIFDEAALREVAATVDESVHNEDALRLFHHCVGKLSQRQADILHARYRTGDPVQKIALDRQSTVGAIKLSLYRARQALIQCIQRNLQAKG